MNTRSSLLGVALELLAMFALGKLDVLILVHYEGLVVRMMREFFCSLLVPGLTVVSFWTIASILTELFSAPRDKGALRSM